MEFVPRSIRVSKTLWDLMTKEIKEKRLTNPSITRAGIIHEMFMARYGGNVKK